MNESRTSFKILDCYSASMVSESFKQQSCSFIEYQITKIVIVAQSTTQLSKATPLKG